MLSLWPELLFLSPISALLIRIALSVLFFAVASRRFRSSDLTLRVFGGIDLCVAIAFFLGAQTQLAAFTALVCIAVWLSAPRFRQFPQSTNWLALVMAVTLLITGPGPFASDLPL